MTLVASTWMWFFFVLSPSGQWDQVGFYPSKAACYDARVEWIRTALWERNQGVGQDPAETIDLIPPSPCFRQWTEKRQF